MFHSIELEWIRAIHQFRTPFLDGFFKALNFFDRFEFFFILIPLVWALKEWRTGTKFFYILLLSNVANLTLKKAFGVPRPCLVDPSLGLLKIHEFSFPSGAAQTVILLSGLLV